MKVDYLKRSHPLEKTNRTPHIRRPRGDAHVHPGDVPVAARTDNGRGRLDGNRRQHERERHRHQPTAGPQDPVTLGRSARSDPPERHDDGADVVQRQRHAVVQDSMGRRVRLCPGRLREAVDS